jgi:hypothetical protein
MGEEGEDDEEKEKGTGGVRLMRAGTYKTKQWRSTRSAGNKGSIEGTTK